MNTTLLQKAGVGRVSGRPQHVLTLTPFFPSAKEPWQGGYVAEPLLATEQLGIRNRVIAVRPFYRRRMHAVNNAEIAWGWSRYFSIPGNAGLTSAGTLLASMIRSEVRKINAQVPIDLIHAHGPLPCGDAAALLSEDLGVPFVVSVHGLDAFATRQGGALWGKRCCRRSERVYRQAAAVICVSGRVQDEIGDTGNTVVLYNGVDTQKFYPAAETSPPVVLSVGNLISIKGHALLLRAFARARRSLPGCRLEIIGEGPERSGLVQLAKELGIAAQVSLLGQQSRDAVARSMARCAVFALPSNYEGLGCVYLEAMSSGKPAIGCAGQGIEEIIESGKNGILIAPGSLDELTEALRTLLTNRDMRERLGKQARETILAKHTLEHQAQQLAGLYRECAR